MAHKGIDVSRHQGNIDWAKVKADGVEFVILRAGYGRFTSQVDSKFEEYYAGAKAVGLPVGCYWFSYARTSDIAKTEAEVCLQVIKGKKFDLPVFYDIEGTALSTGSAQAKCKAFCDVIHNAGYQTGVYASESPFNNALKGFSLPYTWVKWVAKYSSKEPTCGGVNVWQYSSKGSVNGIKGNVDMNHDYWMLDNLVSAPKKSITEIAQECIAGKWGNGAVRKQALEKAGYDYATVQAEVQRILDAQKEANKPKPTKSIEEIAKEVIAGKWGNGVARKSALTKAGYDYDKVQAKVGELLKQSNSKPSTSKPTNTAKYVTVKKGDTASKIAKANGTTVANLKKLNPSIKNINKIYVGQTIRVK